MTSLRGVEVVDLSAADSGHAELSRISLPTRFYLEELQLPQLS